MSRVKIKLLSKLFLSEEDGLRYSITLPQEVNLSSSILTYETETAIGSPLTDAGELTVGDLVMHTHQGVGRYEGIQRLDEDGNRQRDFFVLEYAAGQRLYVPIDMISLLRKCTSQIHKLDSLDSDMDRPRSCRLEALPDAYKWPGLGMFPNMENWGDQAAIAEWRKSCYAYKQALHADPRDRVCRLKRGSGPRLLHPQHTAFAGRAPICFLIPAFGSNRAASL